MSFRSKSEISCLGTKPTGAKKIIQLFYNDLVQILQGKHVGHSTEAVGKSEHWLMPSWD
jgi:hypothetical protein